MPPQGDAPLSYPAGEYSLLQTLTGGTHDGLDMRLPTDCVLIMFSDGTAYTSARDGFSFAGYMPRGRKLSQSRAELRELDNAKPPVS